MANKKVKKKINKKALLVLLLTLYLIIMAFYYLFNLPIKNIIIKGNNIVSDAQIIEAAKINDYPKIFMVRKNKIINNVKSLSEIKDVKIKKNWQGKITIEVTEKQVLFYNVLNKTYVLDDKTEVSEVTNKLGIPTLINYTPSDIYENLIKKMGNIDSDIITLISEIKYSPDVKNDITLDENRFLLRMNDGNQVYINLANFDNLNDYELIYAALEEKGILKLDQIDSDSNNVSFIPYSKIESEDEKDENKLSE